VEEDEANQAHYYELEMIHLTDTITKSTEDSEEKTVIKAKTAAASAKAKGDLADTKKELAADKELKADIEATFAAKSATYEQNQKVRKEELEALAKAIEESIATDLRERRKVAGKFISAAQANST